LLPVEINKERGIENPAHTFEDVCSWLFWGRNPTTGAGTSSQDDKGNIRSQTIRLVDAATSRERFREAELRLRESLSGDKVQVNSPRLILEFEGPNGGLKTAVGLPGEGLSFVRAWGTQLEPATFIHSDTPSASRDVEYFGELEAAKRQADILPTLQIIEPRLQRLALVPFAGETVIHGDIGLSRLMPVPFMGEGLRRLLSIVLAIANTRGGIVLIDEVENGLHYSVMKDVWSGIAHVARQADVQVFATTHSYECVQAAHQAFMANGPYDLRLHRLEEIRGEIKAVTYDQDTLETAIELSHEVR
jgi:hypothetical protein